MKLKFNEVIMFIAIVVITLLFAISGNAQTCTGGSTVLWVSETVNADVGLNATPAGVDGRCTTNTVAGAAYDDPTQPFGIQAAMDCACAGSQIRILAGVNEYGSSSASWTSRRNASKTIYYARRGGDSLNQTTIIQGYADQSTPCWSHAQTGCPVWLDFAGGTEDGMRSEGGFNLFEQIVAGLGFKNAAVDGGEFATGNFTYRIGLAAEGNGNIGLSVLSGDNQSMDLLAHDNGDIGINGGVSMVLLEAYNNGDHGIVATASRSDIIRAISYSNTGSGFSGLSGATPWLDHYVAFDNTNSGYLFATGTPVNMVLNAGVAVNNGRYAAENYTGAAEFSRLTVFKCEISSNNTLGDYTPVHPPNPVFAGLRGTINSSLGVTFPAAPNFSATSEICAAECGYTYPGGDTIGALVAGAAPGCGGSITLQPVRKP